VKPLVSVFMFVRNGVPSVRRALDSVLAQTYPNIEFIVQDGASTDGTRGILESYGDRLKIVSEADSGPSDGLMRALRRCSGQFIGSCLADEELLPDAVERAVEVLLREPDTGAITGDAMLTDLDGRQTGLWTSGPFNLVDYLTADYSPYFCASFFRRETLLLAGLESHNWTLDCIEFETWCQLATHAAITYVPGIFAKYAVHPGQSSNKPDDVMKHLRARLKVIVGLCSDGGFFGADALLRTLFIWGHARRFCEHAMQVGRPQMAEALHALVKETLAGFPPVCVDGVVYDEDYALHRWAKGSRLRAAWLAVRRQWPASHKAAALRFPPPPDAALKGRMYAALEARLSVVRGAKPQRAEEVADILDQ
jgi:Glycosyl transferase family 2